MENVFSAGAQMTVMIARTISHITVAATTSAAGSVQNLPARRAVTADRGGPLAAASLALNVETSVVTSGATIMASS